MGYATDNASPTPLRDQSRSPKRISVTLPYATFLALEQRSRREGRSLSNQAAYLIEQGLEERDDQTSQQPREQQTRQQADRPAS
jgi:hypothetical protein